ncbi:uncharacterized protein Z518_03697 [Rhinocladiella mackenziei CBS 650.93]|uniref:Cut9 interacting protein Scn1 n=1 Tax=Rhinocladiella mackenziei CBS 650.93 TaxID=1442369 RepID=A0A0D2J9C8_9EURO|nr:uncharacterized protein Z518_03697 [Rhinocladiella mackenziei CBS 650.93]KIX05725.1 hypothetical protein Z518_03697 [Rhinocladiella mackenziei CBS 650.93]
MDDNENESDVIRQVGVFDAHCHPTDIMASVKDIATMQARGLTIMSTRSQDQDMVENVARMYPIDSKQDFSEETSAKVIPAFGWHPWFSHQMYDDRETNIQPDPVEHYRSVLIPTPDDPEFLKTLPDPRSLSRFLEDTESKLREFPFALVGEVGLDRSFRLPQGPSTATKDMADKTGGPDEEYTPGSREGKPLTPYRVNMNHQKLILRAQLDLAARLGRPVSVHSVQTHGVIFELMQNMWKGHERPSKRGRKRRLNTPKAHAAGDEPIIDQAECQKPLPFPPRVCMHSYSGPSEALQQFLNVNIPVDIYFSFSTAINFSNSPPSKVISAIKGVPDDRILIESDLHCAGEMMDDLLKDIVLRVCEIKQWPLREGAQRLKQNWMKFVFG